MRSSRRLEAEATRNLELVWLLGRFRPDYRTIADFRGDNRSAFKTVFRAFFVLCRKLDLFGRELLAVDGTGLKAVNNPTKTRPFSPPITFPESGHSRREGLLRFFLNTRGGAQAKLFSLMPVTPRATPTPKARLPDVMLGFRMMRSPGSNAPS